MDSPARTAGGGVAGPFAWLCRRAGMRAFCLLLVWPAWCMMCMAVLAARTRATSGHRAQRPSIVSAMGERSMPREPGGAHRDTSNRPAIH